MNTSSSTCHQCELEIAMEATRERVWKAIFEDTNRWWLPDFHVAGPDSVVTFDPRAGGRGLIEETSDGGGLLWYRVQMYLPAEFAIYLIGHIAPEWGGPSTSSLKLSVEESKTGCVFKVTDARHGNIDAKHIQSAQDGWNQLFNEGLKAYVEKSSA